MKKISIFVMGLTLSLSCSETVEPLVIGFWNAENLFDLVDDPDTRDEEFALGGRKNVTQEIYDLKIKHSAEVMADLNADVMGLCEVENASVLACTLVTFCYGRSPLLRCLTPVPRETFP